MTKIELIRGEHEKTGLTGIALKKHCEKTIKGFHATENSYYPSVFNNGYAKKTKPVEKSLAERIDDFVETHGEIGEIYDYRNSVNSEPKLIAALRELSNVIGKDRVHSIVDSL